MQRAERLTVILDRVAEFGSVDVGQLAASLGVSGATVRRDLASLSHGQLLVRTHGGALANSSGDEIPARVKAVLRLPEKRRIARTAAELVADGTVVGMTGGSTSVELARVLAQRRGITVVTNALNVAQELVGHAGVRLVVVGGIVRHSYELVGPAAQAMLANYHFDVAFIGVDGLSAGEGCTTYDEMEAQTDLAFLRRSERRVVIADSSKLGRVTFARIAPLADIDDVITDRGAGTEAAQAIRDCDVRLTVV